MNYILTRSNLYFVLSGALLCFLALLAQSHVFHVYPKGFSSAITLDLLITMPFLYYLAIRDKKVPRITVLSTSIVGLIIASLIIPREYQASLDIIKIFAIPLIELGILGIVIYKARTIFLSIQRNKDKVNIDFYDLIVTSCCEVLPPRIGRILASEIGVIYYAFFPIPPRHQNGLTFTNYKKNRIRSTIAAFLMIIIAEALTMHLILHSLAPKVAWVLAFLSLYTAIQVIAMIRSFASRPIIIDVQNKILILRFGFICETRIPFSDLRSIELNTRALPEKSEVIEFSPLGMLDSHNLIFHLQGEADLYRLYGIKKRYSSLAIYIDQKEEFIKALESEINVNVK